MWPIGHAAGAYLLYRTGGRTQPDGVAVLLLGFAALLPDLIDKPLAWYAGVLPTGRSLSHSLLLVVPLCLVALVLAHRTDRLEWGVAFTVGVLSHLLLDILPALWREDSSIDYLFYPILAVEPYEAGPPTILGLLQNSLTDPYFHLEFVLLAIALVLWRRDGYPGLETVWATVARPA